MPRKNTFHSSIVTSLLENLPDAQGWTIHAISQCTHSQVLDALKSSLLFLSFGHPEGFGLPVAEALASGCGVIGYSGHGGRELYEIGTPLGVCHDIPYGDFAGYISSFIAFNRSLTHPASDLLSNLSKASKIVSSRYSKQKMHSSVREFIANVARAVD